MSGRSRDRYLHQELETACRKCGTIFLRTREAIRKAPIGFDSERCDGCQDKPRKAAA